MRCGESDGSVANIRRVENGDTTFGLSQTDLAYAAFHGAGPFFASGPDPKLRMLIALYPEVFYSHRSRRCGHTQLRGSARPAYWYRQERCRLHVHP